MDFIFLSPIRNISRYFFATPSLIIFSVLYNEKRNEKLTKLFQWQSTFRTFGETKWVQSWKIFHRKWRNFKLCRQNVEGLVLFHSPSRFVIKVGKEILNWKSETILCTKRFQSKETICNLFFSQLFAWDFFFLFLFCSGKGKGKGKCKIKTTSRVTTVDTHSNSIYPSSSIFSLNNFTRNSSRFLFIWFNKVNTMRHFLLSRSLRNWQTLPLLCHGDSFSLKSLNGSSACERKNREQNKTNFLRKAHKWLCGNIKKPPLQCCSIFMTCFEISSK